MQMSHKSELDQTSKSSQTLRADNKPQHEATAAAALRQQLLVREAEIARLKQEAEERERHVSDLEAALKQTVTVARGSSLELKQEKLTGKGCDNMKYEDGVDKT